MKQIWCLFAVGCVLTAVNTFGADAPAPVGDTDRGARIAARGAASAAPCSSCHGTHGEGLAAIGAPRLAGQESAYLASQLLKFATGDRKNPIMAPVAAALTPAQRADVAAYYSSLTRLPAQSTTEPDGKLLARGAQLAREGDEPRQIQACARCHGADGTGVQLAGPYLAGQSAAYVTGALEEWKDNRRAGRKGAMAIEAERLTEEDIAAVAAYFSSRTVPASSALAVSPETLAP